MKSLETGKIKQRDIILPNESSGKRQETNEEKEIIRFPKMQER